MNKSEAYLNGWHAHKAGLVSGDNPYDEAKQFYSDNQWVSGWCARFDAIKHGYSLSLDLETGF